MLQWKARRLTASDTRSLNITFTVKTKTNTKDEDDDEMGRKKQINNDSLRCNIYIWIRIMSFYSFLLNHNFQMLACWPIVYVKTNKHFSDYNDTIITISVIIGFY